MKFHRSVFFKLFAVYGATFFVIAAGLGFLLFGPPDPRIEVFQSNLNHYAHLLATEIGDPPDPARAQLLKAELGLEVAAVGPGVRWSTSPELLERLSARFDRPSPTPGNLLWGNGMLRAEVGSVTYGFAPTRMMRQRSWVAAILLLVFLAAVLTLSWWTVKRLLRPVRDMRRVFGAFGDHGWADRVVVKGRDELADLGTALNTMADRVEGYVGSMHRLLAGVSHELRSPLTRMKVALEFIDNEAIRASLDEEIGYLDRMTGLLLERERLRARPEALIQSTVSLGPWLEALAAPYRASGLVLSLVGPDLTADFDVDRMAMAVRNLWENALRHAPGSPVTLTWGSTGGRTSLVCEDQGPGIDPEVLQHLGEPFFLADRSRTGNRQKGGFGLGLSLVFSIVEAHGGRVLVENAPPHGLRVALEW